MSLLDLNLILCDLKFQLINLRGPLGFSDLILTQLLKIGPINHMCNRI